MNYLSEKIEKYEFNFYKIDLIKIIENKNRKRCLKRRIKFPIHIFTYFIPYNVLFS